MKRTSYSQVIVLTFFIAFNQFPQSDLIENGTTIITVIRNDTVWIGVDSKVTNEKREFVGTTCKIVRFRDMIFVHAGLLKDKTANIDIQNLFINSYLKANSVTAIADTFQWNLLSKLGRMTYSHALDKEFTPGDTLRNHKVSTILVGLVDSIVNVIINDYTPYVLDKRGKGVGFHSNEISIKAQNRKLSVHLIGQTKFIQPIVKYFDYGDIPTLIKAFLLIECAMEPITVGEPINIIRITKKGIDWIENNQECD